MSYLEALKSISPNEQIDYFLKLCKTPEEVQKNVLDEILETNKSCCFGKRYQFSTITTPEMFQKRVPLSLWSDYVEDSKKMELGASDILFNGKPIHFIATSGTTGERKLIPESETGHEFKKIISNLRDYHILSLFPEILKGKFIALSNSPSLGLTEGNIPIGSASGFTTGASDKKLLAMLPFPLVIKQIKNQEAADYALMRFSIPEDVRAIVGNNAGRIPGLLQLAQNYSKELISDIKHGTLSDKFQISSEIRKQLETHLVPNPEYATFLKNAINSGADFLPSLYWKNLLLIKCWLGGSVGRYITQLKPYLQTHPNKIIFFDAGYGSSECKFNVPLQPNTPYGPLALFSAFYEFIPVDTTENKTPPLLLHQLEDGKEYNILVTTYSGLYRYNMKDIIRVEGFTHKTPNIAFISKTSDIANIAGEKLSGKLFTEACTKTAEKLSFHLIHFCVVPNDKQLQYNIFIELENNHNTISEEDIAEALEQWLAKHNIMYEHFRKQHLLNHLTVTFMKKGWQEALYAEKEDTGISRSQIKLPVIYKKPPHLEFKE